MSFSTSCSHPSSGCALTGWKSAYFARISGEERLLLRLIDIGDIAEEVMQLSQEHRVELLDDVPQNGGIVVEQEVDRHVLQPVPFHLYLFKLVHEPEVRYREALTGIIEPVIVPLPAEQVPRDPDEYLGVLLHAGDHPVDKAVDVSCTRGRG